jgi:hypothetical protein
MKGRVQCVGVALILGACSTQPDPPPRHDPSTSAAEPQVIMDQLLQRVMGDLERKDVEQRQEDAELVRYYRLSDADVARELGRYCPPTGTCSLMPGLLQQEAERRGLIRFVPSPHRPGMTCVTIGLGEGDAITDCE